MRGIALVGLALLVGGCGSDEQDLPGLFVVNRDGSDLTKISGELYAASATWSPDGDSLAFSLSRVDPPDAVSDGVETDYVVVASSDGETSKEIEVPGRSGALQWSEDGERIQFVTPSGTAPFFGSAHQPAHPDRLARVGSLDVASGEVRATPIAATIATAAWRPDGRSVAFSVRGNDVTPAGPGGGDPGTYVWEVGATGGRIRPLLHATGRVQASAFSPDGRKLAYAVEGDVWLASSDGSSPRLLARRVGSSLAWAPDSRRLVAGSTVLSVDGSQAPVVLADVSGLAWSPDGSWLAGAGGFIQEGLIILRPDGGDRDEIQPFGGQASLAVAEWSPSGEQLAFYGEVRPD